jgi:hypothetical protein
MEFSLYVKVRAKKNDCPQILSKIASKFIPKKNQLKTNLTFYSGHAHLLVV